MATRTSSLFSCKYMLLQLKRMNMRKNNIRRRCVSSPLVIVDGCIGWEQLYLTYIQYDCTRDPESRHISPSPSHDLPTPWQPWLLIVLFGSKFKFIQQTIKLTLSASWYARLIPSQVPLLVVCRVLHCHPTGWQCSTLVVRKTSNSVSPSPTNLICIQTWNKQIYACWSALI